MMICKNLIHDIVCDIAVLCASFVDVTSERGVSTVGVGLVNELWHRLDAV